MEVKGYTLVNEEKVERALLGTVTRTGSLTGGVQNADGTFDADRLLAEYDRLGGLVKKGEDKVKMGSFYDFAARKPREKASVMLEFRINGKTVEVAEEAELPSIVKAKKQLDAEEAAEEVVKVQKKAGKNK